MNALEIVKKTLEKIEKGNIDASDFTEDMTFSGPVPTPLKLDGYVTFIRNTVGGIPDWKFNAHDYKVEGDVVLVKFGITGTHTKTLPALLPGMSAVPATNRRIKLPEQLMKIRVRGDKICEIVGEIPAGGGVWGLLAQLGVTLKKAA